jgi:hypothetical protein
LQVSIALMVISTRTVSFAIVERQYDQRSLT